VIIHQAGKTYIFEIDVLFFNILHRTRSFRLVKFFDEAA